MATVDPAPPVPVPAPSVPVQGNGAVPVAPPPAVPVVPVAPVIQVPVSPDQQPPPPELRIYGHSNFFYWWPVWVTGYIMAALTWMEGVRVQIGDGPQELFHPSKNLGVIYTIVFFLVIVITNVLARGLASVVVILGIMFMTVLLAWLGWWEHIVRLFPHLSVHMNLGFYIFFSTLLFMVWFCAFFIHDRLSYWVVRPGQITHDFVIGGAAKSYDTRGMVFEKQRKDFFRQWVLGLGTGDIKISTFGARREELTVPNVLFVDWKVQQIQKLIAMRPEEFAAPVAT